MLLTAEKIVGAIAALALAMSLGPILLKRFQSKKEDAETDETTANKESISVKTATEVVMLVRKTMAEQERELVESKNELSELQDAYRSLSSRVRQLEENERVNLIWFAEHRSWSDQAYKRLVKVDPDFPPPPSPPWTATDFRPTIEGGEPSGARG